MTRENDRFLKQMAFHLYRLAVYRSENIGRRAVVGLQILVWSSFCHILQTTRLRVMLTISLSDVQATLMKPNGSLEESSDERRLLKSLEEMADEVKSTSLLSDRSTENRSSWSEVKALSDNPFPGPVMNVDRYAAVESFYKLAVALASVPELHIMWLLHLYDAHQGMQSWAEAVQCAVAVAGVVMQAVVWSKEHVAALLKLCPMVNNQITFEAAAAEVEGYGASKLTVDSALRYLQLAIELFSQAELYHFCASILELVISVYETRRAYGQLANCHKMVTNIYESILEQETNPIPFADATYYRVGFYGDKFGKLDKKEYVYREPRDIQLGDIMDGSHRIHIIQDSRQVKADELQSGVCYLHITAVDSVMEDEDLRSRRERIFSFSTGSVCALVFDRFLFDTPSTNNGKTQGGLEDLWKRRTPLQTDGLFPALVNRLFVLKSDFMGFSSVENAIGMIETSTAALRIEFKEPRSCEGDQLPRLQSLQRIIQGSLGDQVHTSGATSGGAGREMSKSSGSSSSSFHAGSSREGEEGDGGDEKKYGRCKILFHSTKKFVMHPRPPVSRRFYSLAIRIPQTFFLDRGPVRAWNSLNLNLRKPLFHGFHKCPMPEHFPPGPPYVRITDVHLLHEIRDCWTNLKSPSPDSWQDLV